MRCLMQTWRWVAVLALGMGATLGAAHAAPRDDFVGRWRNQQGGGGPFPLFITIDDSLTVHVDGVGMGTLRTFGSLAEGGDFSTHYAGMVRIWHQNRVSTLLLFLGGLLTAGSDANRLDVLWLDDFFASDSQGNTGALVRYSRATPPDTSILPDRPLRVLLDFQSPRRRARSQRQEMTDREAIEFMCELDGGTFFDVGDEWICFYPTGEVIVCVPNGDCKLLSHFDNPTDPIVGFLNERFSVTEVLSVRQGQRLFPRLRRLHGRVRIRASQLRRFVEQVSTAQQRQCNVNARPELDTDIR